MTVPVITLLLARPTHRPTAYSDSSAIQADAGYKPEYPTKKAIEDDACWLRAGNAQ